MTEPRYFATAEELREWLEEHHATARELLVGYHKRHTGRPSPTWAETVDEALCFGWIDGIRRRVDDERYTIRFTPRKPKSRWSTVNLKRVAELTAEGRMREAGLAAFAKRDPSDEGYSTSKRPDTLDGDYAAALAADTEADAFFRAQPPSYRRAAVAWVTQAKREETRQRRLATLIADSRAGRRIAAVSGP